MVLKFNLARVFFLRSDPQLCATIMMVITYFIENCSRFRTQKVAVDGARAHILNYIADPRFPLFLLWPPCGTAGKNTNVGTAIEGVYIQYIVYICIYYVRFVYNIILCMCVCVCINGGGVVWRYPVNDHRNYFMSRKQFSDDKKKGRTYYV